MEKRVVLVAVASAVVMISKRHGDTGIVGAVGALHTGWCSILRMTRTRPGSTATETNEGLADVQGHPMTAENGGEAVVEMETRATGMGKAIVTVTLTVTVTKFVTEGAEGVPVQTICGRHLDSDQYCIAVRPKRDGWEGKCMTYRDKTATAIQRQLSPNFESQLPERSYLIRLAGPSG